MLSIAGHGKHTVSARAIDNVGRISGTASQTALVDTVAPVISKVEPQPDSRHTEMTLAVTATDADSGVKGYAVTTEEKAPAPVSYTHLDVYKRQGSVWTGTILITFLISWATVSSIGYNTYIGQSVWSLSLIHILLRALWSSDVRLHAPRPP